MKYNLIFFILFPIVLTLAIALLFFRDDFLFFINGYDTHLANTYTVESFEAYKHIYKSEVIVAPLETILASVTFFMARKLLSTDNFLVYKLGYSVKLFTKSIENNQEVAKSFMYRGAAESFLKN
jgi:hypothetical protein